jgi:hypothetical protein
MEKKQIIEHLTTKLGIDADQGEAMLNEILAIHVVPNLFRQTAVQRMMEIAKVDKEQAERAVNEFVGAVTSRAALFEEVVGAFTNAAVTNKCDQCRDCFNCGKAAFAGNIDMARSPVV